MSLEKVFEDIHAFTNGDEGRGAIRPSLQAL